jgi:hypothetical protein
MDIVWLEQRYMDPDYKRDAASGWHWRAARPSA